MYNNRKDYNMFDEEVERKRLVKKAHSAQWHIKNRERVKEKQKIYRATNGHLTLRRYRKRLYGLSHEDYLQMLTKQNNKCAICCTPIYEQTKDRQHVSHVDHCHITGKVRGLLCRPCNFGLGHFKDSLNLIRGASQYLLDNG